MNNVDHRSRTRMAVLLLLTAACRIPPDGAALAQNNQSALSDTADASLGPSVREITAAFKECRRGIISVHVRHTNKTRFAGAHRDVTQITTFKCQNGMAFVDTQDAPGMVDQVRPLDPERALLYLDGRTFYKLWQRDRLVVEYPIDKSVPLLSKQLYLDGIAMWPFSSAGLSPVSSTVFYLPEALESNAYLVVARHDLSTGSPCTVLHCHDVGPAHFDDRIWLDEAKNWALRKRVTRAKPSPNRQDSLMIVALDGYREMAPGIWMPWRIETSQLRRLRGQADEFGPITNDTLVVNEMAINCRIDESEFRPEYRPGSFIRRPASGTESVLPGGHELLDVAAANVRQFVQGHGRQQSRALALGLSAARWILPVVLVGMLPVGACVIVQRDRKRGLPTDVGASRQRSS
jgi:hypothetical protein